MFKNKKSVLICNFIVYDLMKVANLFCFKENLLKELWNENT